MFRWILPRRFNTCGHNWNNSNIDGLAAEAINIERNHWRMWWRRFKVSLLRNSALRIGEFFQDSFGILLGFFWDSFGIFLGFIRYLIWDYFGILSELFWTLLEFMWSSCFRCHLQSMLDFCCTSYVIFLNFSGRIFFKKADWFVIFH